tara:strand:- start:860 stop:1540 length:681 start_codon:yes stop_codon:yes gene_type:complete
VASVKLLAKQQTTAFFPQATAFKRTNTVFNANEGFSKADQAAFVKAVKEQQSKAPQVIDSNYIARKKQDKLILKVPQKGVIDLYQPPLKVLPPGLQPAPIKPKPGFPDLRPGFPGHSLDPYIVRYKNLLREHNQKKIELAKKQQEYEKLKEECDKLRNKNIFGNSSSIVNKIGKTHERFVRQFNFIDIDDLGHGSRLDMGIGEKTSKALALGVGLVALLGVIGRIE